MKKLIAAIVVLAVILAGAAAVFLARHHHGPPPIHPHALVGCWEAQDSSVFIFRDDGTFIGRDFRGRRIWGSWVALNDFQIGFQSLFHTGKYSPQYAETTRTGMRYAYSDGPGFIECVKIDRESAARRVALATLNQKSDGDSP